MTDTAAGGTRAEPTTQPQAGTSSASAPQAGTDQSSSNGSEPLSLDEAKKLRQEHNALRKRVAEYETAAKAAEEAKLSETEKLQKQLSEHQARTQELEHRIQRDALRLSGYQLAPSLGIADVSAALALVQVEHGPDVAYDPKTNEPTNLEALLKAVLKDHPALAGNGTQQPTVRPASSGGATNPGASVNGSGAAGGSGATITASSFRAMSMQERIARSKEIDAILVKHGGRLPD